MGREVRCTNRVCGAISLFGADALGRTFRCPRCGTKLPRSTATPSPFPPGPRSTRARRDEAPWEQESTTYDSRRTLGVAIPKRLGRFEVTGLLGNGPGWTGYRGYDAENDREVELKVSQPGTSTGPPTWEQVAREVEGLSRLRHPGIVPVYETGRAGNLAFLVTAYAPGKRLSELLAEGPLHPIRAAEIAADVAEALAFAHDRGVHHQHLDPSTIVVTVEGSGPALLTDFRSITSCGAASDVSGAQFGVPAYTAPEQVGAPGKASRASSDQYRLAAILFEMLCGRPPFLGDPELVLDYIQLDEPLPPRAFRVTVPPRLERICLRALEKAPGDRYPSCRHLATELREWIARGDASTTGRALEWIRRRPAMAASALLALLGLTAGAFLGVWLGLNPRPPEPDSSGPITTRGPLLAASRNRHAP